jgi:arylsulfatase A-like enzyme
VATPDALPTDGVFRRFRERALRVGETLFVLLVLVHLPLELLYQIPGLVMYLPMGAIFEDAALLVLLYAVVSVAVGILAALPAALLDRAGHRLAERWTALWVFLACLMVVASMIPIAQAWWRGARAGAGVAIGLGPFKYLVIAPLAAWILYRLWRAGLVAGAQGVAARLRGGRSLALGALAGSALLVLVTGHAALRLFGWSESSATQPVLDRDPHPNVVLVIIDTLAAQDMSLYGFGLATTPALARFGSRSYVFEHFYAGSNFTTSSTATLITGRQVISHKVFHIDGRLRAGEREMTLPGVLHQHGFTNGGAVANTNAHPLNLHAEAPFAFLSPPLIRQPSSGPDVTIAFREAKILPTLRDLWWNPLFNQLLRWSHSDALQRRSPHPPEWVVAAASQFLARAPSPYFLWAHFLPPHSPYLPPQPYMGSFLPAGQLDTWTAQRELPGGGGVYDVHQSQGNVDKLRLRYDEHLAYIDHEVGAFLDTLEREGRFDDSIIVVTSDHGESFERGWQGHTGPLLNEPLIRVPLIIHLPGQTEGRRVASWAGHVDLLPTLLELLKLPVPEWAEGRSLVPALSGDALEERVHFAMNFERSSTFSTPQNGTIAAMQRPLKLVHYLASGCEELYDLSVDAGEAADLSASQPQAADRLRAALAQRTGLTLPAPAQRGALCTPLGNPGKSSQ